MKIHTNKVLTTLAAAVIISSANILAAPAPVPANPVKTAAAAAMDQQALKDFGNKETMALLWMRASAEYRELCYQGYNVAMAQVDKALADPARKEKPLAIVLDCDETVVDNMKGLAESAVNGGSMYPTSWWQAWSQQARAGAMPGAAEFLNGVHQKGVSIFYVTNRDEKTMYNSTAKNLKDLHFPSVDKEHLLLATTTGNKQIRFDKIAAVYDVVVYMGDNTNDLPLHTHGLAMQERNAIVDAHQADFGTKYIAFPNPVYGNWVLAIDKKVTSMTPQEREQLFRATLLK